MAEGETKQKPCEFKGRLSVGFLNDNGGFLKGPPPPLRTSILLPQRTEGR